MVLPERETGLDPGALLLLWSPPPSLGPLVGSPFRLGLRLGGALLLPWAAAAAAAATAAACAFCMACG